MSIHYANDMRRMILAKRVGLPSNFSVPCIQFYSILITLFGEENENIVSWFLLPFAMLASLGKHLHFKTISWSSLLFYVREEKGKVKKGANILLKYQKGLKKKIAQGSLKANTRSIQRAVED
ncbi:CLUMA_CG005384, isoform A [Clunio marinus]|uniref:CLUMA_CG005384, isoform A n=1 Tax=Clunio marinus TaxID=568069 RepID=A0A1J1HYY5_9DIPT|nr:CLUMA_CG005384, isoform A [Clunio marinus]